MKQNILYLYKMKLFFILALAFISCLSCENKYQNVENKAEDYVIIPKPVLLEAQKGRFLIDHKTKISGTESLSNEGDYLARLLSIAIDGTIEYISQETEGNIILEIDQSIESEEGYTLIVTYDKIVIKGKSGNGVFYGIQSLRQLISGEDDRSKASKELTVPAVIIRDSPRFSYRGMHLDVTPIFYGSMGLGVLVEQ